MIRYITIRLCSMAVTVLLVITATFAVARLLPGSVVYTRLGETATARDVAEMERIMGLDRPWFEQFGEWTLDALRLDLGESLTVPGLSVTQEIRTRMPVTIELAILSLLTACLLGIPVGVISALNQDGWADYVLRVVAVLGLAVPTFWLLTLLITFSAAWWSWLPPLGYRPFFDDPIANLQQFALPSLVLGFSLAAPIMRLTRSTMLETIRADYVRTARAKGLHSRTVIGRHALKNAMIPVVTVIGLQMGNLLGGTVIIESVSGLPGLGRLMVDSITRRDYTMLQGAVIVAASFTVLANFAVDIVYVYLDPRIRLSLKGGGG